MTRCLIALLLAVRLTPAPAADSAAHGSNESTYVQNLRSGDRPNLKVEVFANSDDVQNVTAICFDDKGRLYVAESGRWRNGVEDNRDHLYWVMDDLASVSTADRRAMLDKWKERFTEDYFTQNDDRVVRLEDTDGDGIADQRTVFADGFNDPLDGPAIGLLSGYGKIYLTNIPHLWVLEDADDDGVAEKRESLQEGFGPRFSLSGHDLHGLVWGPDGKLYFSMGDRGYHLQTKEGNLLSDPGSGAVFRCDPDGGNLEIYYYSLRNPQELAFNEYGDLFTVDNNCDQGDEARVCYLMEGGETGWHMGHQALTTFSDQVLDGEMEQSPHWMSEGLWKKRFPGQPAWILPPLDYLTNGPSGLVFHSGTSLPPRYWNHFLVCDYKGSSNQCFLYSFKVRQEGAGYAVQDPHVFHSGITAADVDVSYDGKIYLGDFGGGWRRPDRGNIYVLYDPEHVQNDADLGTANYFKGGIAVRHSADLAGKLAHPDWRLRLRCQYELAKRGEEGKKHLLDAILEEAAMPLTMRLHGLWGLGQMGETGAVIPFLQHPEPEIRAQAAKILGDHHVNEAAESLTKLLSDISPRVRSFSAIALGKLRYQPALPAVIDLLAENADVDPFVRHAGVMALQGIPEGVDKLTDHSSSSVRLAAALALRKRHSAAIVGFLKDPDPQIRAEVIRAVNDLPIQEAMPAVAQQSERLTTAIPGNEIPNEPLYRRLINVNFRLGDPRSAMRLFGMAKNTSLPVAYRLLALRALSVWPEPPPIDPTLGIYRPLPRRGPDPIKDLLAPHLLAFLQSEPDSSVTGAGLRVANAFHIAVESKQLRAWLLDPDQLTSTRLAVLKPLQASPPDDFEADLEVLQKDASPDVRAAGAETEAALNPAKTLEIAQRLLKSESAIEKRTAYRLLAQAENGSATLTEQAQALVAGQVPETVALDLFEICQTRPEPEIQKLLAPLNAGLLERPSTVFSFTLQGGDSKRGGAVFLNQGTCRKCHRVEGDASNDAGPGLEGLATRMTPEQILDAIIHPNAEITPGYGIASYVLKNGKTVTGTPLKETEDHVTVKTAFLAKEKIAKSEIVSQTPVTSPMPPMGLAISKLDLRDLMAYLKTLTSDEKNFTYLEK